MFRKFYALFLFVLLLPLNAHAISGACSWHNGVNCPIGAGPGGKVVCNDGWINSSVYFSDTEECGSEMKCPRYYPDETYKELKTQLEAQIQKYKGEWQSCLDAISVNSEIYGICERYNSMIFESQISLSCLRPESERYAIFEKYCKSSLPNSTYDQWENKCSCPIGYEYQLAGTASAVCAKIEETSSAEETTVSLSDEEIKRTVGEIAEDIIKNRKMEEDSQEQSTLSWNKLQKSDSNKEEPKQKSELAKYAIVPNGMPVVPGQKILAATSSASAHEIIPSTDPAKPKESLFSRYKLWSKTASKKLWEYVFGIFQ